MDIAEGVELAELTFDELMSLAKKRHGIHEPGALDDCPHLFNVCEKIPLADPSKAPPGDVGQVAAVLAQHARTIAGKDQTYIEASLGLIPYDRRSSLDSRLRAAQSHVGLSPKQQKRTFPTVLRALARRLVGEAYDIEIADLKHHPGAGRSDEEAAASDSIPLAGLSRPSFAGIIHGKAEVPDAMRRVVATAEVNLWCTGSRSRNDEYLRFIEERLRELPELIHHRVLYGQPVNQVLKDHLLALLEVRDPFDRTYNCQTLCIGLYDVDDDNLENRILEAEHFMCANEKCAVLVLPSLRGIGNYDTCLYIEDAEYAGMFGRYCESLYNRSDRINRPEDVHALRVLRPRK